MTDFEHPDLPEMATRAEAIEILASMEEGHRSLFDQAVALRQRPASSHRTRHRDGAETVDRVHPGVPAARRRRQ